LVVLAPVMAALVMRAGLPGAGWAWLGLNVAVLPVLMPWLHRRVLPGATRSWLDAVGRPLLASVVVLAAARWLAPRPHGAGAQFAVAVAVGAAAVVAAALASPVTRSWVAAHRHAPH
jgi:hypothetical protein